MSQNEIRVGIVGANSKARWAKVSHIPVIDGLPGLMLAAVATRNEQSAREAAEAVGAEPWFSDTFAMIDDIGLMSSRFPSRYPNTASLFWQRSMLARRSTARRPSDAP